MQVEEIELSQVRRKLVVDVPTDEVKGEYGRIEAEVHKFAALPGFRKGRVPIELIRKMFRGTIEQEATKKLIESTLSKVLEDRSLKPVGQPEVTKADSSYAATLHYEVEIEVMPALQVENYRQIPLKRETIPVTEEDVERRVLEIRKRAAEFRPVDTVATEDYWVILDVEGWLTDTAEKVLDEKGLLLALGPESGEPRIAAELVGARAGDLREFTLTFGEGERPPELVGKTVRYKASVTEVKEQILPALDDEFATTLGDYSTLDELRDKVRVELVHERDLAIRKKHAAAIMNYLATAYPIEVPSAFYQQYALENTIAYKQFLERSGKTFENLEDEMQKAFSHFAGEASGFARVSLILEEIARLESISVSDEEFEDRVRKMAEDGHKSPEGVKAKMGERGQAQVRSNLLKDKVIDFLIAEATID